MKGLAPSASAVKTLAAEAGIESETLQRFLARYAGVAEGRLTNKDEREMRAAYKKTVLVVDDGSLASTHVRAGGESPKPPIKAGILLYLSIAGIRSDQRSARQTLPARLK